MLEAGASIGTYRVLEKIGEGGMGTVYLGEHTLLGRRSAIKVLLPSLSGNEQVIKRFFNEARVVSRLTDPGIVQIFDFGYHTDGSAFFVMELLEGEPMDKRLARIGRFGVLECLRLIRLMCTSLHVAHAKGIVHRDLKPENIVIVSDPAMPGGERAKILDFGIAKLSGDEPGNPKTRTGLLVGTPGYMSPEQCRGGGAKIDHRSDIYAIACVMFTMLTGRPPFDGTKPGDLITAHLREPPPLASSRVPDVPSAIDQILQHCLRKSPANRFQSMTELVQAIEYAEKTLHRSGAAANAVESAGVFARSGATLLPKLYSAEPSGTFVRSEATPLHVPTGGAGGRTPTPTPGGPDATLSGLTTLNDASGQSSMPGLARWPRRLRERWIAGLVSGMLVIVGAAAFVALRGRGDASPQATSGAAAGGSSTAETHAPSTAIGAMPSTVPPPTPMMGHVDTVVTATPDGGVADAPSVVEAIDAAVRPPHRRKPAEKNLHQPKTEDDHASSTGSATRPLNDRGD